MLLHHLVLVHLPLFSVFLVLSFSFPQLLSSLLLSLLLPIISFRSSYYSFCSLDFLVASINRAYL